VLSTSALHDDRHHTRGALVIVTDLTAVKALERNQRRLDHLTLMARFYAGIAHEIRGPLTSISNFVSLLTERFDDAEYRETASRLLPLEVDRIAQLADRLRFMAPSEGAQMTAVDLNSLLRDLIRLHTARATERSITVVLQSSDDLPVVRADPRQLVQLFLNLINNAIEAMPGGGEVTIEASHHGGQAEGAVAVQIADEGTGIDASIASKVFDPFFTTKTAGTGLGLSICREIADFHGATLTLRRRRDRRGTIAEVKFPSAPVLMAGGLRDIDETGRFSAAERRGRA
jgi:signal transduction histidine kinase